MTDDDRAYYRARYEYAVRMADESDDSSAKAVHLVMAAEYRQRAALDDETAPVPFD